MRLPEDFVCDDLALERAEHLFDRVFQKSPSFPKAVFRWVRPIGLFSEFEFGLADFAPTFKILASHFEESEFHLRIDRSGNDRALDRLPLPWHFEVSVHELDTLEEVVSNWPGSTTSVPNSSWTDQYAWVGSSGMWGGFGIRPQELFVLAFSSKHSIPDLLSINRLASVSEANDFIRNREPDPSRVAYEHSILIESFS